MDDPNITMEEYIRLEEEKLADMVKLFDNTTITSEPTVCPPNENKIDFRISFDESDDEDYTIEEYTEGIRHSYEQRLEMIWSRPVNRVHVLDFEGLTPEMRQDLAVRLRMVYSGEGHQVFVSHAWRRLFEIRAPLLGGVRRRMTWRQFILALGLHTEQEMAEAGGQAPEKVTGVDLFYLRSMDRGTTNVPHLLAQYLFRHAEGRKSRPGSHLRAHAAAAGAHEADKAGLEAEEGAQEISAPAQAPPPPLPAPHPRTMSQRIERIEEEMHDLWRDVIGL
ncbi:hypothetical protein Tco_0774306 [Tanacetum coccineum]|uniref:Uncharacterized protein n=1 Tax=Tanacetum coccineum TaxID=301880 RepID=A0ABQ4ZP27_9ASTR